MSGAPRPRPSPDGEGDESPARSPADRYFADAVDRLEAAFRSAPPAVRHIRIGDHVIRFEVSPGAMERAVLRAFAHLAVPPSPHPDLTITAWDSETSGWPSLAAAWTPDAFGRHGFVEGFNDARFHTASQFDPLLFRMIDFERRRALYFTPSAPKIPYWERGAPLRPLLHEWLGRSGFVPLHGGAVGFADGGVLIAGAGGRGKSNVALACLDSALSYASDDFCCVSLSDGWKVHSLYGTGKIAGGDFVRHPLLSGRESNPARQAGEKALFFLHEHFAGRLIRQMPLRAIVLPRIIASGESTLMPAAPAAAQKAIAMSTIELSRWTGRDTFAKVGRLVRDLPCYELKVGASLSDVPLRLAALLERLR